MSTTKSKGSKLDAFAAELLAWESAKPPVTLEAMRERLAQRGCSVSSGRLSDFLSAQRQQAQTEARMAKVLGSIASGAQTVQRVESEFAKNAPPELATLIRLLQVLIMELSTQAFADPALLELVASLMKPVLEFAKLDVKRGSLNLDRQKFAQETCELFLKWYSDQTARAIAESNASNADKIAQLRQTYFADVDALQKSGKVQLPA